MEREEVLRLCHVDGGSLLDVGVGPLATIAARDLGCQVTTVDIDPESLISERRRAIDQGLGDRISLVRADASRLPFMEGSFESVVVYGALHHIPPRDRRALLEETFRAASERLCVAEYTESGFPHPGGEFQRVELGWLRDTLVAMGPTRVIEGEEMNLYILQVFPDLSWGGSDRWNDK
ncbi:MAG: class I SAM-dependent methyltransferase [Methanomassiliicoccales archaeon]